MPPSISYNMNIDEILGRETVFSGMVLLEYWKGLTVSEKVALFATLKSGIPSDLLAIAVTDSNAVVRMVAVAHGAKPPEGDLPIVQNAKHGEWSCRSYSADALTKMGSGERFAVFALAKVGGAEFVKFLRTGLASKAITEGEAAAYTLEYVKNPRSIEPFLREPFDGMDWAFDGKDFDAVWEFVCEAPSYTASYIAFHFPLETKWRMRRSLDPELLSRMSDVVLGDLARRQFEPLIEKIAAAPQLFSNDVIEAARRGGRCCEGRAD